MNTQILTTAVMAAAPVLQSAPNPAPAPDSNFRRFDWVQKSHISMLDISNRYKLTDINVYDEISFDYGDYKGPVDVFTKQYFGRLMTSNNYSREGYYWGDDDADSGWFTKRFVFEITDILTGQRDYFDMIYNIARDTDGENADYTLVALQPHSSDPTHRRGDEVRVFNSYFNFDDLVNDVSVGNTLIRPYIFTGHDNDAGGDSQQGNILDHLWIYDYDHLKPEERSSTSPNDTLQRYISRGTNHDYWQVEGNRSLDDLAFNTVRTVLQKLTNDLAMNTNELQAFPLIANQSNSVGLKSVVSSNGIFPDPEESVIVNYWLNNTLHHAILDTVINIGGGSTLYFSNDFACVFNSSLREITLSSKINQNVIVENLVIL